MSRSTQELLREALVHLEMAGNYAAPGNLESDVDVRREIDP